MFGRVMSAVRRACSAAGSRLTGRRVVAGLLVLLVLSVTCVGLSRFRVSTDVTSFLPSNDDTVTELRDRSRAFGGDPVVVLLETEEPRHSLLDRGQLEAVLRLEGALARLPDTAAVYGPATVVNQLAISIQGMLAQIAGRRDAIRAEAEERARNEGLSPAEVRQRGDRAVAGFELRYGSLLVQGLPAGLPTLHNERFVRNVIYDDAGRPRPQWHFVVPDTKSVAILVRPREDLGQDATQRLVSGIRSAIAESGVTTSRVTVTGIPAITSGLAEQARQEAPWIGALAVVVMLARLLLVPSGSGWLRRLSPLFATLAGTAGTLALFGWLDLRMSLGAVALLPLLLGIGSSFPLYLSAVENRRRVVVVALAAAAAFASLMLSPLPFVQQLGLAMAVGVGLTTATGVVLGLRVRAAAGELDVGSPDGIRPPRRALRWSLLSLAAVLAAAGWATLPHAAIQADPRDLAQGISQIADAEHAERLLGSSGELSVVLRGDDVLTPEAFAWSRRAEAALVTEHGDDIRPVVTMAGLFDFLGDSPTAAQIKASIRVLPSYLTGAVVSADGQQALMNFGVRIQDLREQHELLLELERTLPEPPEGFSARIAGLPVAADRGYTLVSDDRYVANIAGIVAAGAVLVLGLRRRADAFRGIAAALVSTGWALGALALLGIPLTPLTITLGTLTTVTACEFAVLLADARRRPGVRTRRLVTWACVTSAFGYLVLALSSLALLRQFGLVLGFTVLVSFGVAALLTWLLPGRVRGEERPAATAVRTGEQVRREIHT